MADEHLATAVCDFILSQIKSEGFLPAKNNQLKRKALFFGVEEEQHYIGLKMVSDAFKDQGWSVRYLGPSLPIEHSLVQINKFRPDVIGLSAALSYRLSTIKDVITRFSRLEWKPLIMVGGRMAKKFDLSGMEAENVIIVKDLNHLNTWFQQGREDIMNETS
ncbi:cobalamin B12-binding domain-containing protein [Halobacillus salinarum]|uniref:Cobalamin B12-binding domain-containing protein n=1 Tax=Halobacillus salinarum TaxID=2932257 RepID=A0ABY4EP86_9BACI|nr:cobalamin B12-binding domain-containing protein [Halobacillus salinarum]UOQ46009.1 cobalamin B12-binding domain-containing protein [Halobacillus salinarum]